MRDRAKWLLAFAWAAAGCVTTPEPTGSAVQFSVCAHGTTVEGVDVSEYQGTINWTQVAASGRAFAIARISDGTGHLDPTFATNWSGIHAAGMVRGAYQFFEPGQDPVAQANVVISAVGTLGPGDLPCVADVEVTGGQSAATIVANLQTWISHVQAGTGRTPMIYTAPGWWDGSVRSTAFGGDPLWVANWGVTCPTLPSGWTDWIAWQYSDTGSVSGISGAVDLDRFNGDRTALNTYTMAAPAMVWGGQFVMQSFPNASVGTVQVMQGSSTAVWIEMRNSGTTTWDTNTRLATTVPRDRVDMFAGTDWVSDNRPAAVTGTVAPGGTFRFNFSFHAPATLAPGMYTEYFGMVEDGVTWFSDPGEGGPPDNQLEAIVQVLPGATMPDSGATTDAGATDSGAADVVSVTDSGASDAASASDAHDAGAAHDAASDARDARAEGGDGGVSPVRGGCACHVVAVPNANSLRRALLALGFAMAIGARRRRRRLA